MIHQNLIGEKVLYFPNREDIESQVRGIIVTAWSFDNVLFLAIINEDGQTYTREFDEVQFIVLQHEYKW